MISPRLETAFNDQINKEFFSFYLYLAMAAHFDAQNLPGFAKWMKVQAEEERGHATRLWGHLTDRGGRVLLKAIADPTKPFGRPREIFEEALAHERTITASIHALHALALAENDPAAAIFLEWFVTEQVEEEKNASDLVEKLKLTGDQSFGLLFMDQHIVGERK